MLSASLCVFIPQKLTPLRMKVRRSRQQQQRAHTVCSSPLFTLNNCCSLWPRSIVSPPAAPLSPRCCYLAGAQHSRHAVAVPQRELDLDVDSPGSLSRDPHRPQPVVLAGAHHITHLRQRADRRQQASRCEVWSHQEGPPVVVSVC